jgi:hypothetical protein
MAGFFGFSTRPRRKNSKAARLRKMTTKINKLEKKHAMDKALEAASKKLASLRRY